MLRPFVAQLATVSAAIEHAVNAHPDGKIVTPLFRAGRICVAQLLAKLGDDRARVMSGDHLAAAPACDRHPACVVPRDLDLPAAARRV